MQNLRAIWLRVPFRHMTTLVIALFVIKEQFPFSNFPMYSNFDEEADVIFVANQNDQPVPMSKVFRTGSAQTKKTYKAELGKLTASHHRDSKLATPSERAQAGGIVLSELIKRIKPGVLPAKTTSLRLYRRTFALKDDILSDTAPERIAEQSL